MRAPDRLRRVVVFCFRTRRRAQLAVLVLAGTGWLSWYAVGAVRAHLARSDAERALARYDFPAARDRLELATRLRPHKAALWLLAAQAARRDGDLAGAKNHLARYQSLIGVITHEGSLEASLQRVQQGDIEYDLDHLMFLVDSGDPAGEQILEALAVGSIEVYRIDRAEFWVHHLLTRFPKNPVGRLNRARMDDLLGKHERAAEGCRELLADFPENDNARRLLAGQLFLAQRFAEAADEYEELLRRGANAQALLGLARCRERTGRLDETRALLRELEERFPDNSEALLECGRFALREDRAGDAEPLLRRALQLAPSSDEIHYQLGLCLERLGRTDEARRHLERFKEIEIDLMRMDALVKAAVRTPEDPAPRREAGLICLRNGQTGEGLRWLYSALKVAPTDKATHRALADFYRSQGDPVRSSYHERNAR
jgi:tetratricopeptide (TPR) repeat protein